MIDVESLVFTNVATPLRSEFSGIRVYGEAIAEPAAFPTVTLVEQDNATYTRTVDSMTSENHATIMYQAEAYSNLSPGKKAQCKAIMAVIDTQMLGMGFTRIGNSPQPIPNSDKDIYRMVARYRAVVSKDNMIYHK